MKIECLQNFTVKGKLITKDTIFVQYSGEFGNGMIIEDTEPQSELDVIPASKLTYPYFEKIKEPKKK